MGPVLCNIFVNKTDSEIESTLSKLANDKKLSGGCDRTKGWKVIYRDLEKHKKWAHKNILRFNKSMCRALHLSLGNHKHDHRLGGKVLENSLRRKTWDFWWT